MNFKTEQKEHIKHGILFGSEKEDADKFINANPGLKFTIVNDKDENRFHSMFDEAGKFGAETAKYQRAALEALYICQSYEELAAIKLGLVGLHKPKGFMICGECLRLTIANCQEQIEALKDLQKAMNDATA